MMMPFSSFAWRGLSSRFFADLFFAAFARFSAEAAAFFWVMGWVLLGVSCRLRGRLARSRSRFLLLVQPIHRTGFCAVPRRTADAAHLKVVVHKLDTRV